MRLASTAQTSSGTTTATGPRANDGPRPVSANRNVPPTTPPVATATHAGAVAELYRFTSPTPAARHPHTHGAATPVGRRTASGSTSSQRPPDATAAAASAGQPTGGVGHAARTHRPMATGAAAASTPDAHAGSRRVARAAASPASGNTARMIRWTASARSVSASRHCGRSPRNGRSVASGATASASSTAHVPAAQPRRDQPPSRHSTAVPTTTAATVPPIHVISMGAPRGNVVRDGLRPDARAAPRGHATGRHGASRRTRRPLTSGRCPRGWLSASPRRRPGPRTWSRRSPCG